MPDYEPTTPKEPEAPTVEKYETLEKQVQAEYRLAYDYMQPKRAEWLARLKLFNNQRRDKEAVGDTMMFSTHQTVLAGLYNDRLTAMFNPREEGDTETAANLTLLAKNDFTDMGKDEIDYYWDWDACFYGRGLISLFEYIRDPDKKIYLPVPENLDPCTFLRDPRATSVNGNRQGRGAMRFGGIERLMTRDEMEDHPDFFVADWNEIKFGSGTRSLIQEASQARSDAQNTQHKKDSEEKSLGANGQYEILEWYTHWKVDGKVQKVRAWLANQGTKVVGFQKIDRDYWKIIDRPLYPSSNDWDGTSIPDLTEDKQRARAVAQNLGLKAMKSDLLGRFAYNSNLVKNRHDLDFGHNKHIPIDGPPNGQIVPVQGTMQNMALLNFIYQTLDVSAQKATATPDVRQGIAPQADRTLGETNLVVASSDQRGSLAAKVFGWSERTFWMQWYQCYKEHFADEIDEKVLRLTGPLNGKWRPLRRENIVAKVDPDVSIDSESLTRAKRAESRALKTQFYSIAFQDPQVNRRYGLKDLAELNGLDAGEIDSLIPPTIDERIARDENDLLSENEYVQVQKDDDHLTHLEEHKKAADTDQTHAHIETHKLALTVKKQHPEFFPPDPVQEGLQPQPSGGSLGGVTINAGSSQPSPMTPPGAPPSPAGAQPTPPPPPTAGK